MSTPPLGQPPEMTTCGRSRQIARLIRCRASTAVWGGEVAGGAADDRQADAMLARAELGEQLVAEDHQQPAKMVVAAAGAHAPVAVSPGVHLDKLTSAGGKQRSSQARVAELGAQQPRHHRALLVVPADPQRDGL